MKRNKQSIRQSLDQAFVPFKEMPPPEVGPAWERIRDRSHAGVGGVFESLEVAREENRRRRWGRVAMIPAAAAVMLAVFIGLTWRQDALAIGESVDGSLLRVINGRAQPLQAGETISIGDTVRSDRGGTLKLADGSGVELKSESELSFEGAKSALQINLSHGSVIVNSETQPVVQTRDVTVPIAGTVLVNAESEGSRVAVIQGEARVRQGAIEKTLRPGEQIATNPSMELSPVSEEIAWSPRAGAHMAMLQQSVVVPASPNIGREAAIPKWEAVSVRPCENAGGGGRSGGGAGAGNGPAVRFDPVFLVMRCQGIWQLVMAAYGNLPDNKNGNPGADEHEYAFHTTPIVGGPAWMGPNALYTIEAKAEKPVDRDVMRGPMLQTILEDRFKLKLRRESRDIPMHVLTVAKGGPKLKPHQEGSCAPVRMGVGHSLADAGQSLAEVRDMMAGRPACGFVNLGFGGPPAVLPPPARHKTQEVRGLTVEEFIHGLMLGFVQQTETPVVDKTGIKGKFDFKLEYAFTPEEIRQRTQGGRGDPRDANRSESDFDTGPTLYEALEDQLGLKLEKTKGPWPHFVIEHVERPSPN
jgi:uncharacterized protein (TIGR03435 family)